MLKSRFEVFAAVSLALHAGLFASALARRSRPPPPGAGEGGARAGEAAAAVAGETFEVPELEQPSDEVAATSTGEPAPIGRRADSTPALSPFESIELDERPAPQPQPNGDLLAARPTRSARGSPPRSGGSPSEPSPPPALYGAVGDRSAGDLVTTFKRTFPIAASSDPLWERIPVGFYADGDVTFFLADDGSLTHATASAASAAAFRAAIARTTTLLRHRLFTARGATTHLHMVVRVTGQLLNHGAFTIDAAGSFELPSGKHVSVSIVER